MRTTLQDKQFAAQVMREMDHKRMESTERFAAILATVIALIIFLCSFAHASEINLAAIAQIESSNGINIYNPRTQAIGMYQVRLPAVRDFNRHNPTKQIKTINHLVDRNEMVARWYFGHIKKMLKASGVPHDVTYICASYNLGVGKVIRWHRAGAQWSKLPRETRLYVLRYKSLTTKK